MTSLQIIEEISQLVENGSGGLGKRFVNEAEMLQKIEQLRMTISSAQSLQLASEMELLVKQGSSWFGKRSINELNFFTKVQQLVASLAPASPAPSLTPTVRITLQRVDDLEKLVEDSKGGWLGKRFVNKSVFLTKTQQLRPLLPFNEASQLVDALDQLVTNGSASLLGHHPLNEEEFFMRVQELRSAYASYLASHSSGPSS